MQRGVIFCAALGAIFPYPAVAVTDEASGLGVDPTLPFMATITSELGSAPSISVSSNTGLPAAEGGDHIACSVGFQEATSNALLTQEKINQISAAPGFIGLTRRRFETAFEVGEPTTFSVAGVTGIEFDGIGETRCDRSRHSHLLCSDADPEGGDRHELFHGSGLLRSCASAVSRDTRYDYASQVNLN